MKKDRSSKKVPALGTLPSNQSATSVADHPKSPLPSTRRKSASRQKSKQREHNKQHRFQKKTFSHPTWCQYAHKFIWGINKSGYQCRDCGLCVSRRYIGEAKKSVCGQELDTMDNAPSVTLTEKKVFTIYLPHGAKKSIIMDPNAMLGNVLEKVCMERGIDICAYVPEDTNGKVLKLNIPLGKIEGNEITFTKDDTKKGNEGAAEVVEKVPAPPSIKTDNLRKPSTEKQEPLSGRKRSVVDAYEFGPELGSGAFSIVRSATHHETGKVVAIKILDKYDDDDEQTAKFKQEIAIISSLHHENIVQFYELDEDDENFYVVMELVGGGELFDFIIDNGALSEPDAAKVAAQVLKAVEYMHAEGTAHRDLKPENLLFSSVDDKIVKIADFGESKSFRGGKLSTYCGTPDYMAPEIIRGDNYGPEVDVWAIGVITYVMLAGFPPFDGENDVEVFASILSIKYDFPSPEWDKISSHAKEFIQSILVDKPEKRLTASQALAHPWIVNNVAPEFRVNKKENSAGAGNSLQSPKIAGEASGALQAPTSAVARRLTPPATIDDKKDKRKSSKREIPNGIGEEDGELDLNKKPKKVLGDAIDEILTTVNQASEDSGILSYLGELKAMKTVVDATSGKPKVVELERVIYLTYWKRVKEIHALLKKSQKKKK